MKHTAFHLFLLALLACPVALSGKDKPAAAKPAEAMKRTIKRPSMKGTLDRALKQCQKLAGLKFMIDWDRIEKTGVKRDTKVSLSPREATVEQLLDLTLSQVAKKGKPLGWFVAGRTVSVTTQARALKRARLPSASRAPRPPARKPRAKRSRAIRELDFNKTPLSEVITFMRTISGLNIHVNWRALATVDIDKETPITIKVKNVSIKQAMDLIVDQLGADRDKFERIYWLVDGNVLMIAPGRVLNTKLRTKVIDVADLLMPIRDFEAKRMDLSAAGSSDKDNDDDGARDLFKDDDDDDDDDKEGKSVAEQKELIGKSLIEAIKDSIGQDMWRPDGKGSIRLHRDKLIISQTLLGFKLLTEASWRR